MEFFKKYSRETIISVLVLANLLVWTVFFERRPDGFLSVYFFDVGQGDAIFIDSPGRARLLIDGGKNRKILTELGRIMPFADRRIDIVVATHPDTDHIGGLPDVISRYEIGVFIEPGVRSENFVNDELHKRIFDKQILTFLARRGMVIHLDSNTRFEILFPTQDVSNWETNRASIVARLVHGDHEFLLTGDSPSSIENVLILLDKDSLSADVLKVGHHGSRTSTSPIFVETVSPIYAVVSAGRGNSYGHPHQEVTNILNAMDIKILSTVDRGTIEFKTNGKTLEIK